MTRHTPSNQFNKDIDKVFNHYRKYGDNYKKIAKNTKDMLKKVYNIGPDEWDTPVSYTHLTLPTTPYV